MLQDLRYTLRTLRRDFGFAAVAILILGIGIGANTAIFSLVNALLLRPLPFPGAERLVWIENGGGRASAEAGGGKLANLSERTTRALNFRQWREQNRSFEEMGAFFAFYNYTTRKLTSGAGDPERLVDVGVTRTFFETLGVQPALGRLFTEAESQTNGPKAALISYRLWERRFNADRSLVGRAITLDNEPVTIVGVMPESFDFAAVFAPGAKIDLWSPFPADETTDRWGNTLSIVGRLKPGVRIEAAQADLDAVTRGLQASQPNRGRFWGAGLRPLQQEVSGRLRAALFVLFGAVGAVLLIACANLSNLLLARAASRQQEIAVRTALGASRWRLVRQLLTESLVLSTCGALLGIALAVAATRGVTSLRGLSLPLLSTVHVDGVALAFTIGVALVTALLFGIAPALQMSGVRPLEALKQGVRGSSSGTRAAWIRRGLVVAEVAMACVLLVVAGLLMRSFMRVLDVDLGFQPAHTAALRIQPPPNLTDQAARTAFYRDVIQRIEAVPGIESAGLTDALPLDRNRTWTIAAKGQTYRPGEAPPVSVRVISRGYFKTMGIAIKAGEAFSGNEKPESEGVVILNATAARTLWPGRDPIGQSIIIDREFRVIGIVADVRHSALEEGAGLEMYLPITRQGPAGATDLVMRTTLPIASLAGSVRRALQPLDPTLPTAGLKPMQELVDTAVSPRRFVMWLLAAFAGQALLLACLGIYGVVSYSVTERTREIGIRMALGASRGDVQRRVLRDTLVLAAIGAVAGVAGAVAAGRLIASLLFDTVGTDPTTFAGMLATLTIVALLAGYIPARRASRIDAMAALRAG
jgi:predicted permease